MADTVPGSSHGSPPKLLDRVRQAIRARHYSRRTEEAYVHWIRRYIVFHDKVHPSTIGAPEISAFLTWLAVHQHVSASTQNQALSALLFLYRHVLGQDIESVSPVVRARTPDRLPVVLSREEVSAVLQQLSGTMKLVALLLYGAGLRLGECLELRVKDIDVNRREILIRQGKGQKDRVTMLPSAATAFLTSHLEVVRRQHHEDLARGLGRVVLPFALDRKYARAATEWQWQFVFPAADLPRSELRSAIAVSRARIRRATGGHGRRSAGADHEAGNLPFTATLVRHSPSRGRIRHPHRTGAAGTSRCEYHDGIHARAESGRARGSESGGSVVNAGYVRPIASIDSRFGLWPTVRAGALRVSILRPIGRSARIGRHRTVCVARVRSFVTVFTGAGDVYR